MTAPRQVLPGKTYLTSRRCSERRFLLKPTAKNKQIFLYALGVYAKRYRILIHAFCVLSNHYHLLLTDPYGLLPHFFQDLHSVLARANNCYLGRWDAFWERTSYSAVELVNGAAVHEKLVYLLANPVAAGLVRHARNWPGLWSDPSRIGGEAYVVERPKKLFDEDGDMPAVAELQLTPPPGFENDPAFVEGVLESLREAEELAAEKLEREGRTFLGAAAVLAQSPFARPGTAEPRRGLSPRVACRNKWKRIEALGRLKEFVFAYKAALDAWREGVRDALFPEGTWKMRVLHAARCAGSG
jgi:REP element-mobilizing transposase RayT